MVGSIASESVVGPFHSSLLNEVRQLFWRAFLSTSNKLSEVVMWHYRLPMTLPDRVKRKVFHVKVFAPVRHEKNGYQQTIREQVALRQRGDKDRGQPRANALRETVPATCSLSQPFLAYSQ
jgi:hypothetical protein